MVSVKRNLYPGARPVAFGSHGIARDLESPWAVALPLLALHDQGDPTRIVDVLDPRPMARDLPLVGCVSIRGATGCKQNQGYEDDTHFFSGGF